MRTRRPWLWRRGRRGYRPRNPLLVGIVGLCLIALAILAAFRVADLPFVGGGARYHAAFRDASGLVSGNEVRVAGVRVGSVTGVGLARAGAAPYVRVDFRITEGGVVLGDQTTATIRIKTVLGQKFLSLEPAGAGGLAREAEIPLNRTASPFDVMQAVTGLADTVQRIDVTQLANAFTVLSDTFADTPAAVRSSLTGLARLSQTVASRDDELRQLLARAHTVTGVLADRDEQFQRLLSDANLLLAEVQRRRDAIHNLLVSTNDLAVQLSGAIADNRTHLAPALAGLRQVVATLQQNRADLEHTITSMAPFITAFTNVLGNGRWFDSWVDGLLQPYVPSTGGG
jgi:phospholipid/cholesterol/gamma-HCH transport system substrate-binding protein